jgi:hypothetical protein
MPRTSHETGFRRLEISSDTGKLLRAEISEPKQANQHLVKAAHLQSAIRPDHKHIDELLQVDTCRLPNLIKPSLYTPSHSNNHHRENAATLKVNESSMRRDIQLVPFSDDLHDDDNLMRVTSRQSHGRPLSAVIKGSHGYLNVKLDTSAYTQLDEKERLKQSTINNVKNIRKHGFGRVRLADEGIETDESINQLVIEPVRKISSEPQSDIKRSAKDDMASDPKSIAPHAESSLLDRNSSSTTGLFHFKFHGQSSETRDEQRAKSFDSNDMEISPDVVQGYRDHHDDNEEASTKTEDNQTMAKSAINSEDREKVPSKLDDDIFSPLSDSVHSPEQLPASTGKMENKAKTPKILAIKDLSENAFKPPIRIKSNARTTGLRLISSSSSANEGEIPCSKCQKLSMFWCQKCSMAFCYVCWGGIAHHRRADLNQTLSSAGHLDRNPLPENSKFSEDSLRYPPTLSTLPEQLHLPQTTSASSLDFQAMTNQSSLPYTGRDLIAQALRSDGEEEILNHTLPADKKAMHISRRIHQSGRLSKSGHLSQPSSNSCPQDFADLIATLASGRSSDMNDDTTCSADTIRANQIKSREETLLAKKLASMTSADKLRELKRQHRNKQFLPAAFSVSNGLSVMPAHRPRMHAQPLTGISKLLSMEDSQSENRSR